MPRILLPPPVNRSKRSTRANWIIKIENYRLNTFIVLAQYTYDGAKVLTIILDHL